jgi:NTP-dependent ternary system trypsin peptidase co-occuring protein
MAEIGYMLDDGTVVRFEFEPPAGFQPAGTREVVGKLKEAVEPLVAGAMVVLEKVRTARPNGVEVKFGVKASGTADWLIAKAATEGNFEITLTWTSRAV